jgi:hypothetical protein
VLITDELANKRKNIFRKASLKEKLLFAYLVGEECPSFEFETLTDTEKVCASAFCDREADPNPSNSQDQTEIPQILDQHRRRDPGRKDHYTESLIELCAFAIHDLEPERQHLQEYCTTHPAREGIIIQELFGEEVCSVESGHGSASGHSSKLDEVALRLGTSEETSTDKELLLDALQESNTLPEYYVVRTGYLRTIKFAPCGQYLRDAKRLGSKLCHVVETVRWRYRMIARSFTSLPFLVAIVSLLLDPSLPFVLISKIISLTVSILMILTGVAKGWEWFLKKIDRGGEKLGEWRLEAMGVSGHEVLDLGRNYSEDTLSSEIELSSSYRYDSKPPVR